MAETANKTTSDIRANLSSLYNCQTEEQAQEFVASLPPETRRKVLMLADSSKAQFLKLKPGQTIVETIFPLSDATTGDTTQSQVNMLYDSLFALMDAAKNQAEAGGKKLHIIVGEQHVDRTGLLASSLVLYVAKRLGIYNVGAEFFPEESYTKPDGIEVLGYPAVSRLVDSFKHPPSEKDEGHSTMVGAARKNIQFEMMLAKSLGMSTFSNDPRGTLAYHPEATLADTLQTREISTVETFHNMSDKNLVSLHGYSHLSGLVSLLENDDAYTLFINTTHTLSLHKKQNSYDLPHEMLANALPLPFSPETASELGKTHTQSEIIYAHVPGKGITTAKQALEMAEKADQARGEICERHTASWVEKTSGERTAQKTRG